MITAPQFAPLYKVSASGSILTWKTFTEANLVITEHGFLDGTIQQECKAALMASLSVAKAIGTFPRSGVADTISLV